MEIFQLMVFVILVSRGRAAPRFLSLTQGDSVYENNTRAKTLAGAQHSK